MQLVGAESMRRDGPPKYTAGFARSFVSGCRRSPTPPASTMTSASSTSACMRRSAPAQHDARGRAVAADDAERQAEQVVAARLDVAKVQALDDHDAGTEQ